MEQQEQYLPEKQDPSQLISLALERGADPEVLKKLMDLQERWESGQARKAYVLAMTGFKQEAPAVLKKHDRVDFTSARGRTAYNYANLGSIIQEISALLGKHQLSASWGTAQENNRVVVTCHITHAGGHRESVTLSGPIDESGNKNAIQAVGSTVTYLQRYTLLAALGLATIEDDDDGRQGNAKTQGKPTVATPQSKSAPPQQQQQHPPADGPRIISDAQRKRFYAICKANGKEDEEIKSTVYTVTGQESTKLIPLADYENLVAWAETPLQTGATQEEPEPQDGMFDA